jgi:hypothetical protein
MADATHDYPSMIASCPQKYAARASGSGISRVKLLKGLCTSCRDWTTMQLFMCNPSEEPI